MNSSFRLKILFALASFGVIYAQVGFPGRCPDVKPMKNFNLTRYLGKWYEYENYYVLFEEGAKCVSSTYVDNNDGTIKVFNNRTSPMNKVITTNGTAILLNPEANEGRLKFSFFPFSMGLELFGLRSSGNYWVLDTDYTNYTIVWDCDSFLLYNFQTLWILTRARVPAAAVVTAAENKVKEMKLDLLSLKKTTQSPC